MTRDVPLNLDGVPLDRVLSMARRAKPKRDKAIRESGQLSAELHKRGLSWRVIGAEMGVAQETARYWAREYERNKGRPADADE